MKLGPFNLYRHDLGGFMRRWIFATPWGAVRVHNILRGDADLELHTHPGDFVSFILRGGYWEELPADNATPNRGEPRQFRVYIAPAVNTSFGDEAHRIHTVLPNTWTLVFMTSRKRKWGFWGREGFVPWDEFVSVKGYDIEEHKKITRQVYGNTT